MPETLLVDIVVGARIVVAGAFVLSAIVALTHWAVRRGSVSAFGRWPRLVRRASDPVVVPLERRLVRAGANPQDAPIWLVGVVVIAGLGFIALVNWLIGFLVTAYQSVESGFLLALLVHSLFEILMFAVMIRVIASWLGIGPYSKPMRVVHALTDWLIDPLQRVIPPIGIFDVTPIAAYFLLYLAEGVVMRGLF
ncbi:MAG TPA: YggT family protein [Gemmatimonadales bacterium]